MLLALVACGGSDEPSVAAAGAASDDGGSAELGRDLALPDWFPSPFTLPEGLRVTESFEDPGGQRAGLYGVVDGGDRAAIVEELVAGLPGDGFERATDGTEPLVFLKDGVGRVRIYVGELMTQDGAAVEVRVDIDTWSDEQLDQLRVLVAEDVETTGQVSVVIDGVTYEAAGECAVRAGAYSFIAPEDPTISVQVNPSTDPVTTYADVYVPGNDSVLYVPAEDGALDGSVESATAPISFSASGPVVERNSGDGPFDVTFEVVCD